MKDQITKVGHFMEDFGQQIRYQPVTKVKPEERLLRVRLLLEEVSELAADLGVDISLFVTPHVRDVELDPARILDHLTDILYVLLGAYCTFGLGDYAEEAFDEVHRSNMSKKLPDGTIAKNTYGKVIKGPNFSPADFHKVIDRVRSSMEPRY